MGLEALAKFREDEQEAKVSSIDLGNQTIQYERLLQFDQALAKTGWVFFDGDTIQEFGMIKTTSQAKGFEDSFQRAALLYHDASSLIQRLLPSVIGHEMPSVGKMHPNRRNDSSLIAAVAIRCAGQHAGVTVGQVQAQSAKLALTGNRGASKKEVGAEVDRLFPGFIFNEDIRDAICLALKFRDNLVKFPYNGVE